MQELYPITSYVYSDPDFPAQLHNPHIHPSCTHIYARGLISSLHSASQKTTSPLVAIVGTRKASTFAKKFAHDLAYTLAQKGAVIISGLAYGIDAEAHRGALDANGATCAVLANGLDTIYPAEHQGLASSILEKGGMLISEYPVGTRVRNYYFIERNGLISGLSDAVVIIEAPAKSGSKKTGLYALAQHKKVFVLPGDSHLPAYKGSHELIRAGAQLFTSAKELCLDLGFSTTSNQIKKEDVSPQAETILTYLFTRSQGASVDKITEDTTLKPQEVQIALTELLIKELLIEEGIGRYRATGK